VVHLQDYQNSLRGKCQIKFLLLQALANTEYAGKVPSLREQGSCHLVEDIKVHHETRKVTFFYYDGKETCREVYIGGMLRILPNVIDKFGPPKNWFIIRMGRVNGTTNLWAVTVNN
jgi:hypothetical protein